MEATPLELGRHQTYDGGHEADECGNHATTDLDDGALKRPDFATHLAKFMVDPRETSVDSIGEVVKT